MGKATSELNQKDTVYETTQSAFTCSTLTIKTLEQGVKYVQSSQKRHRNDAWRRSGVFIVNVEHILHLVLVFLLLTLNM